MPQATCDHSLSLGKHRVHSPLALLVQRLGTAWQRRREQRIAREAFLTLRHLDHSQLKDIGISLDDVEWAAHLPLETDAATVLQECKHRRATSKA